MFKLRFTSESQPRSKNGQPPQITTGVASTNSIHEIARIESKCCTGCPGRRSDIARKKTGKLNATEIQKRRDMDPSSGFSSSCAAAVRGSSAMPQIGHEPGPGRLICGCIGQV